MVTLRTRDESIWQPLVVLVLGSFFAVAIATYCSCLEGAGGLLVSLANALLSVTCQCSPLGGECGEADPEDLADLVANRVATETKSVVLSISSSPVSATLSMPTPFDGRDSTDVTHSSDFEDGSYEDCLIAEGNSRRRTWPATL
jgi:hypothetical protein